MTRLVRVMVEARISGKTRMARKARVTRSPRRVRIIWGTKINSTIC